MNGLSDRAACLTGLNGKIPALQLTKLAQYYIASQIGSLPL